MAVEKWHHPQIFFSGKFEGKMMEETCPPSCNRNSRRHSLPRALTPGNSDTTGISVVTLHCERKRTIQRRRGWGWGKTRLKQTGIHPMESAPVLCQRLSPNWCVAPPHQWGFVKIQQFRSRSVSDKYCPLINETEAEIRVSRSYYHSYDSF